MTLCHPEITSQENILRNESLTVKGIGSELITLPVAKIPIKYQGWNGMWKMGITDQLPAPCLIGLDLSEHVKSVLVNTLSQNEKRKHLRKNMNSLMK